MAEEKELESYDGLFVCMMCGSKHIDVLETEEPPFEYDEQGRKLTIVWTYHRKCDSWTEHPEPKDWKESRQKK